MIRVRHLFVSPGHGYFGCHDSKAGEYPVIEVAEIECVAGRGVRGDRFFDYRENYKGQITFFAWEVLIKLRHELELLHACPSAVRRNVITEGLDLMAMIGREFELQGLRFSGVEECRPCAWMNLAVKSGTEIWLKGRGGLRCRILSSGFLRCDPVVL